jgi:hypothetical protein
MPPPKQRATTLQEKFGFVDEDLRTPQHDAMLVWIDQHAEELIQEFFSIPTSWSEETIDQVRKEAKRDLGEPPPRKLVIESKIWEYPIVTKTGFAVGFADMAVMVRVPRNLTFCTFASGPQQGAVEWHVEMSDERVFFEAKTSIRSVGELIRQIRLYQEYLKGHYIVVSPDERFAEVLRGQRIHFLKYDE